MAAFYNGNSFSNNNNYCAFCKRNKEPEAIFKSHLLKDHSGLITCPQLSKYRCELCGATGQFAHTRSYCPLANNFRRQCQQAKQEDNLGNIDESSTQEIIKVEPGMFRNMSRVTNSRYNSAGRLRFQYRDYNHQNQQASVSYQQNAINHNHGNGWRPTQQQQQQQQHLHLAQLTQRQGAQTTQLRGQRYDRNFAGDSI